jgi:hypothetical protein
MTRLGADAPPHRLLSQTKSHLISNWRDIDGSRLAYRSVPTENDCCMYLWAWKRRVLAESDSRSLVLKTTSQNSLGWIERDRMGQEPPFPRRDYFRGTAANRWTGHVLAYCPYSHIPSSVSFHSYAFPSNPSTRLSLRLYLADLRIPVHLSCHEIRILLCSASHFIPQYACMLERLHINQSTASSCKHGFGLRQIWVAIPHRHMVITIRRVHFLATVGCGCAFLEEILSVILSSRVST